MKNPNQCKYEQENKDVLLLKLGTCSFMDEPEKCRNLHGFPIEISTKNELPDNNTISSEQWEEYIRDVLTGKYECLDILKFQSVILDWKNSKNDDKEWEMKNQYLI